MQVKHIRTGQAITEEGNLTGHGKIEKDHTDQNKSGHARK